MADPTIVALIDKASNLARLICPFPEEVDEGDPIERMPDDLLEAATTLGDLAEALATARETAQREAEARLLELENALRLHKAWADSEHAGPDYGGQSRDTHPDGEKIWRRWWDNQLDLCERANAATDRALSKPPLLGAERWKKLLEAIKAVPLGALAENIRLRDATRVALLGLINALAAFEQERT